MRRLKQEVFVEHLTCDCYFNTHHTSGIHLSGPDFLKRKDKIIKNFDRTDDLFVKQVPKSLSKVI